MKIFHDKIFLSFDQLMLYESLAIVRMSLSCFLILFLGLIVLWYYLFALSILWYFSFKKRTPCYLLFVLITLDTSYFKKLTFLCICSFIFLHFNISFQSM